jgi:hypothetical protein
MNFLNPANRAWIFLLGMAELYLAVSLLISVAGGWWLLARAYRATEKCKGKHWRRASAVTRLPFGGYRNCLIVSANRQGLGVVPWLPFRLYHPPLFFPWSEVVIRRERWLLFWRFVRLDLARVPSVPFRLHRSLADQIRRTIGDAWPEDRSLPADSVRGWPYQATAEPLPFTVQWRELRLASGHTIEFKYQVHSALQTGAVIAVLLHVPAEGVLNENIFGVNERGDILWQIQKRPQAPANSPYLRIATVNGELLAYGSDNSIVSIDHRTGTLISVSAL